MNKILKTILFLVFLLGICFTTQVFVHKAIKEKFEAENPIKTIEEMTTEEFFMHYACSEYCKQSDYFYMNFSDNYCSCYNFGTKNLVFEKSILTQAKI